MSEAKDDFESDWASLSGAISAETTWKEIAELFWLKGRLREINWGKASIDTALSAQKASRQEAETASQN